MDSETLPASPTVLQQKNSQEASPSHSNSIYSGSTCVCWLGNESERMCMAGRR